MDQHETQPSCSQFPAKVLFKKFQVKMITALSSSLEAICGTKDVCKQIKTGR